MALPLFPEYLVGYVLIAWVIWRMHQGNLKDALSRITYSFVLVIPYFIWFFWRWWATGWCTEGGHLLVMHLQWILIPLLLMGIPQFLVDGLHKLIYIIWLLLVLTTFILFVQGIVEWSLRVTPIKGFSEHPMFYIGLSDPLMHPGYLSMIVAIFIMIVPAASRPAWLSRSHFLFGQLFLLVFFVMLSSRMIAVALLLTLPLAGYSWLRMTRKNVISMGLAALFFMLLFAFGFLPKPIDSRIRDLSHLDYRIDAESLHDFSGVTIRLAEWKGALHAIKVNPILGHGPGLGQRALIESYEQLGFQVGRRYGFNAHNQFLQTALDLGWIGAFLLTMSIIGLSYPQLSSGNRLTLWFLVFFLLCSTTESTLFRQRGTVMLALFIPLLGFIQPKHNKNPA